MEGVEAFSSLDLPHFGGLLAPLSWCGNPREVGFGRMGVKHLVLLLVAGLLCAPPASIASSVGGSEALRGKDQCEAAGRSARRGHSTVLVRRNCVEAKTAEDFFRPGPNMKSAPEGLPQPPRPSWASVAKMNIYEDDSEDAKPATPLAAFAGSGWKSAAGAFNKVWGGVAAAPAKSGEWGSAVRGGFSEGGADLAGQARNPAPRQTESAP